MTTGRDLTLSEQFHRLKRTTVLASTAVIITFIPQIELTLAGALSPLAHVDPNLVRALLWVVATYYGVGFVLEFAQEKTAHAGALAARSLKSLQDTATQLAAEIADRVSEAQSARLTFDSLARLSEQKLEPEWANSKAVDTYETLRRTFEADATREIIRKTATLPPTANPTDQEALLRNLSDTIARELIADNTWPAFNNSVAAEIYKVQSTLARLEQAIPNSLASLKTAVRSLRTFGDGSLGLSLAYFYGWELGGAAAIWLLSTYLFLVHSDLMAAAAGIGLMLSGG